MMRPLPQRPSSFVNPLTLRRPKQIHTRPAVGGPIRNANGRFINFTRHPSLYKPPPPRRRPVLQHPSSSASLPTSNKMTTFDVRSIDTFCHSIGNQLKQLPDKEATELVTEIQNLVWNRTMMANKSNVLPETVTSQSLPAVSSNELNTNDSMNCPIKIEPLQDMYHMDTERTVSVSNNISLARNDSAYGITYFSNNTSSPSKQTINTAPRLQVPSKVKKPNEKTHKSDPEQVAFDGIASAVTTLGDSVVQLSVALQELRKLSTTRK